MNGQPRPEWTGEIEVDEDLARRLIDTRFPGLRRRPLRRLATGWDNTVWLVGEDLVVRFPRRAIAVPGVEREIALLPALARVLPLAIPVPTCIGRPGPDYPWPFFGASFIAGRELPEAAVDISLTELGSALGRFLRALHRPSVLRDFGDGLPRDPMGRADMQLRVPRARQRVAALERQGLWQPPNSLAPILRDAEALGPPSGDAVTHCDLHVRHLVIDTDGHVAGIIDWGDVCVGDPSIDLSLYWSVLDAGGRAAFGAAYGHISSEQLLRARVLSLFLNAALAAYAADTGNTRLLAETIGGLKRTLDVGSGIRPAGAA